MTHQNTPKPNSSGIQINLEAGNWSNSLFAKLAPRTEKIWHYFAQEYPDFPKNAIAELTLSNDQHVQQVNAQWRGKDNATNVLSFPAKQQTFSIPDQPQHLGDMILAYGVCQDEANELAIHLLEHTSHLIIHSLLHLLGHDHIEKNERTIMEAWEIRIMAELGYASPYENDCAALSTTTQQKAS